MWIHYVTVTALLCPLMAYLLCQRIGIEDTITVLMFESTSLSFGGMLMWLRSRYLASVYLTERQNRKQLFVESVRREADTASKRDSALPNKELEKEESQQQQRSSRTVARLAPVLPAFIGCCFFLMSGYCLIAAALYAIWYVRTNDLQLE